jgi:23S rRNA (uracil1939-C5)-methyltransferase/tRNA (uracil-5-)-methyltransferase
VETDPNAVVTERVGNLTFQFLAGDFFQNNPFILPAFTGYVAEQAAREGIQYLVDAYCGSGLFALCLAARFEKVAGVEVSETSCAWARRNAAANGIGNAEFITAAAEAVFAAVAFPPERTCVVIDPPRKGCDAEFLAQLFSFGPARVVYVSCDPATQVRDLKQFVEHGYQLTAVQPFDLFPHTRHLECVMTLDRL